MYPDRSSRMSRLVRSPVNRAVPVHEKCISKTGEKAFREMCQGNIETSAGKTRGYLAGEITVFVLLFP